jgi:protein arginine N-methyltransferase 1
MIELSGPPVDPEKFTESNHPGLHYQRMLADRVRMARYEEAIAQVVRPGDVVADLGTGLGVLALMAARAGAARVYAIDNRPRALWVADRVVRENGEANRVCLIEADALEVRLDEPVDVVVNELIGDFGTDEGIHETVAAFARRHLRPGGQILPSRLTTYLVPVQYADEFRGVWRADYYGLDLRGAIDFPCRAEAVMYPLREAPTELAAARVVGDTEFGSHMGERQTTIDVNFEIDIAGTLQGFVGYFEAILCNGIRLGNYPCYATCHWENWNWPVSPPRQVEAGQRIAATLHQPAKASAASWSMKWALE